MAEALCLFCAKAMQLPLNELGADTMELSEFSIGKTFWFAGGSKWRCTDIGTRTVVAIRVDIVTIGQLGGEKRVLDETTAGDEGWLDGPPYAVAECVFDEDEIADCSLEADLG